MRGHGPEHAIQGAIIDYLAYHRVTAWRQNTGAALYESHGRKRLVRFGHPGQSDIIGILPGGRFLAIECKAPGKKATPAQAEYLASVNAAGGLGFTATSVDDVHVHLDTLLPRR